MQDTVRSGKSKQFDCDSDLPRRFRELFATSDRGYYRAIPNGTRDDGKIGMRMMAVNGRAPDDDAWRTHLEASGPGISVVPLLRDCKVRWAALDVDQYPVDHAEIARRIDRSDGLQRLMVCRSKSEGAHVYGFFEEPVDAEIAQRFMRRAARALGFPAAEIFPRQSSLDGLELGNGINMPFYGLGRWCVDMRGSELGAEDFLDAAMPIALEDVERVAGAEVEEDAAAETGAEEKVHAGRNAYLTSRAGQLRNNGMSDAEIESTLRALNRAADHEVFLGKGPLDDREVAGIVKSARDFERADGGDPPICRGDPLGTAKRYASEHDVVHHRNEFHVFTGAAYEAQSRDDARARMYAWLQHRTVKAPKSKPQPFRPKPKDVSDVVNALAAEVHLGDRRDPPMWLDGRASPDAAHVVPVRNGLLDPSTRDLIPHTPAFFGRAVSPIDYDPDAPPPDQWLRFLDSQWGDDPDSAATLRQIFGLCLTANTGFHKMFLVVGPPRSGKGIIAKALRALVGGDNVAAPSLDSLTTDFGMAPLIGRTVATINDARLRSPSGPLVERLLNTSGEDVQTIDRKYRDPWVGRLAARVLIMSNEVPGMADPSCALAERFVVLSMPNGFLGREDLGLWSRIERELPGVLNWALDGLDDLNEAGRFEQPESGADLLDTLTELSSPARAFVKEQCEVGPAYEETTDRLWEGWKLFCGEHERHKLGTKDWLMRDLRAAVPGLRSKRGGSAGDRRRMLTGIRIKRDGPSEWDGVGDEIPF